MASRRPPAGGALLCVYVLLLFPPSPAAAALPLFRALGRWSPLVSLIHSLMLRVADARAEKGDLPGAARARAIAHKLEHGGITRGGILSMCWDYVRNYARRQGPGLGAADEIYRAAGELVATLQEFGRMGSDAERARWVGGNYAKLVSAASTVLRRLSQSFSRSGALKEMVKTLQQEVVDGELLRDCLQVSAGDLEGLLRVARDLLPPTAWLPSRLPIESISSNAKENVV